MRFEPSSPAPFTLLGAGVVSPPWVRIISSVTPLRLGASGVMPVGILDRYSSDPLLVMWGGSPPRRCAFGHVGVPITPGPIHLYVYVLCILHTFVCAIYAVSEFLSPNTVSDSGRFLVAYSACYASHIDAGFS